MRKLWRGIVNFFVEALSDDTTTQAQRQHEVELRQQRLLRRLNRR
jgi:hypothetical protein